MTTSNELAERMKVEILKDVRTGALPATIDGAFALHFNLDASPDVVRPAVHLVDAWIKDGGVWEGIQQARPGRTKINIYRRRDEDEPLALLGNEKPPGDGWFVRASFELPRDMEQRRQLHLMGRNFLIYSSEHARDPQHLGMAVEHFGAAAKRLGLTLPVNENNAPCWLTYSKDDMDAGAPADYQFMLSQIASVFGAPAALEQARALDITWPARAPRPKGKDQQR